MAADPRNEPTADFTPEGAEILEEQRGAVFASEPPRAVAPAPGAGNLAVAIRDAAIGAAIALVLAGPIVGVRTDSAIGGLTLTSNWPAVFIIVAVVFGGRLALNLTLWRIGARPFAGIGSFVAAAGGRRLMTLAASNTLYISIVALALAFSLPFMPFADRYIMDQAIVILTYIMLAWGLNIVVGLAGLLDLGYVAFYAVGAYSFALLATNFDLGFWVCLPMAGFLAAGWGLILGFPVLRLRGDYLAIVTLAFGEIIRIVLLNWYDLTNGPDGISGIPRPSLLGLEFKRGPGGFADFFGIEYTPLQRIIYLYYIILILALVTNFVTLRLRRLPIGRAWEALREDEIACRSLGINTTNTKLTAFACGAFFGGLAGSFFATRQGFISPESFTALESFIILALVVLGGLGSQIGIVIAAIFLNTIFELRELAQYRMLIVGLSMVLIMVWRPRGLISTRLPSVFLKARRAVSSEPVGEGHG